MGDIPVIRIESDSPVKIATLGDMHYGHSECDYGALTKFRTWLRLEPNCYWIGMGDYLENSAPGSSPRGAHWEQTSTPDEQWEWFEDFWANTNCLWLMEGNHEYRTPRDTSLGIVRRICRQIDCYNHDIGGYIVLGVNDIPYIFYVRHGYGSSATKGYHLRKVIEQAGVPDADIVALGHIHQLHHESGIRTGGFLNTPKYAAVRLYRWARVGAPILTLGHEEKSISVDITTRIPE
jgi:predicted phosphodiesterase